MDLTNLIQSQQSTAQQPSFSKEEYAAMKKAEREEMWAKVNELAEDAFSSPEKLKAILYFTARCSFQNTASLLLLHDQNPEITIVKTREEWRKEGRTPRVSGAGYNTLLRQDYNRSEDGRRTSGYNVVMVYDISQVRGRPITPPEHYEPEELVAAVIQTSRVPVRLEENLPEKVQAQYVPAHRTIYVRNDMDAAVTFLNLVREQAHASFDTDRGYQRKNYAAQSYCAAYIAAAKYGLDTSNFDLSPVVATCSGLDAVGKRGFLSDAKGAAYSISNQIERNLNARQAELVEDSFALGAPAQAPAQPVPRPKGKGAKQPEIA